MLNPGSNTLQVSADFTGLASGIEQGTVTLSFGDGSSAQIQAIAIVIPSSVASVRADSSLAGKLMAKFRGQTRLHPMATVAACTAGKASYLIPLIRQPLAGAQLQVAAGATVQVQAIDDCGNPVTASVGGSVQVTFSNGDPGVNLNDVGNGIWEATWTPAAAGKSVVLQAVATEGSLGLNSALSSLSTESVVVNAATATSAPQPTGIANAASAGQATPSVVAPGSYVAIYGTGLAGSGNPNATPGSALPSTLNGTQLLLGGIPMPLLYAAANQVNAIVPQGLAPNANYPLVVMRGSVPSVPVPLTVTELQPATYTVNTSGSGAGIVTDALTGKEITASNPAQTGENLVIYATGLGPLQGTDGSSEPADGAIAPSTILYQTTSTITVAIGGISTPVIFSGLTPTLTGLYQINVQVPAGVPGGSAVPVVVTATDPVSGATASSNTVTIAVQ
jgi:uncharacterized protein (TIGR03437 family)